MSERVFSICFFFSSLFPPHLFFILFPSFFSLLLSSSLSFSCPCFALAAALAAAALADAALADAALPLTAVLAAVLAAALALALAALALALALASPWQDYRSVCLPQCDHTRYPTSGCPCDSECYELPAAQRDGQVGNASCGS